jgi:YHS domain-containing protein
MSTKQTSNPTGESKQGVTACGSRIMVTPNTPYIYFRDEVVYFCGEDCKDLYDEDPLNSCMAARILTGK